MRGIVLAGGSGSRLWPVTLGVSKQLLPIYNKPLIFYSIATLMLANIREIIIITTLESQIHFQNLLGSGSKYGVNFTYLVQKEPKGIAEAFLLCDKIIGNSKCILVLGDNIFHGLDLKSLAKEFEQSEKNLIFGFEVSDPSRYGVAEFNPDGSLASIQEKPIRPKSNLAVTGLYFYQPSVFKIAKKLKPSLRGELEITDVNNTFIKSNSLILKLMPKGSTWLDTGTFESLFDASNYVRVLEERQGKMIGCLEEIALESGWISRNFLLELIKNYPNNSYKQYIQTLLKKNN